MITKYSEGRDIDGKCNDSINTKLMYFDYAHLQVRANIGSLSYLYLSNIDGKDLSLINRKM